MCNNCTVCILWWESWDTSILWIVQSSESPFAVKSAIISSIIDLLVHNALLAFRKRIILRVPGSMLLRRWLITNLATLNNLSQTLEVDDTCSVDRYADFSTRAFFSCWLSVCDLLSVYFLLVECCLLLIVRGRRRSKEV